MKFLRLFDSIQQRDVVLAAANYNILSKTAGAGIGIFEAPVNRYPYPDSYVYSTNDNQPLDIITVDMEHNWDSGGWLIDSGTGYTYTYQPTFISHPTDNDEYDGDAVFLTCIHNVFTQGYTCLNSLLTATGGSHTYSSAENIGILQIPNIQWIHFGSTMDINGDLMRSGNRFVFSLNLTTIALPNYVTGIQPYALMGCPNLNSITLGENISGIYCGAFADCPNLNVLKIYTVNPPSILTWNAGQDTTSIFSNSPVQHIYVPADSVNAYRSAAGWSDYANIISAIPEN